MAGLVVFRRELDVRKNAFPYSSWSYDEEAIKSTRGRDLCDVPRSGGIRAGGHLVIDDRSGFTTCDGISISDVARINVFECRSFPRTYSEGMYRPLPPPPPRGGSSTMRPYTLPPVRRATFGMTFVYTNAYMERMARDQRVVVPLIC
jgi:hypothetical protein